ncbi:hypothetical protein [Caldisphaera lagunensis]|nr:hypothetical protein [Caldisphaera lagunensis]
MEKDILAYYNYTNNNIYINVSGMAYPYSYYISGISIILKNGSYIVYDSYSGGSNSLQIIVKGANNRITTYNSLPVSLTPNSSALIIVSNIKSNPIGISISVVNGKSIASIPVENVQQIISALKTSGVVYIVPPVTKIITNKYFNVTFNINFINSTSVHVIGNGQVKGDDYNWSVSFDEQTKSNIGYVYKKGTNDNTINFSNGTNITFTSVPSGYYYYYNISDLYFYNNTQIDYICYPNPSSGILFVNQNTNVSITYTCPKPHD